MSGNTFHTKETQNQVPCEVLLNAFHGLSYIWRRIQEMTFFNIKPIFILILYLRMKSNYNFKVKNSKYTSKLQLTINGKFLLRFEFDRTILTSTLIYIKKS